MSEGGGRPPAGEQLARQVDEERRRALRALLMHPLLCAGGPWATELQLVRMHAEHLRVWLQRHAGWTLVVDAEVARLRKTPSRTDDTTRPAVDATSGLPFTRRRYVLLCLALAVLERSERQTTLGRLAERLAELFQADPALGEAGLDFDLGTQDARRDLVHAVRLLLESQVLLRVQGEEQQFLSHRGDVLYTVNRAALAAMLALRRPPSTVEDAGLDARLERILEEPLPESEEAHNRRIRVRLARRLLDDAVLYHSELSSEEAAYLTSQRPHLVRPLEQATGLVSEVRAEGLALVDEGGELTDLGLPEEGTEGHLALLVAEHLANHARTAPGDVVPWSELRAHVAALIEEHGAGWRKDAREPGADAHLTAETVSRLRALALLRETDEGVVPMPAIGRFALARPEAREGELFPASERAATPRRASRRTR
ncbi:TIGR02678 family protein [Myxococcus fulvus]|uniref:TIGR02678 family protein n=1 Tax=Myxococcus fulvus TaxID=33 RepID=UPI0020BFE891|nr:TIGR02678 family protein [Myxococcus fulvus]MCK8501806.1 TIGR02678 family protein [Myxococcus fulvus]